MNNNQYVLDAGTQKNIFIAFAIGVVLLILGVLFTNAGKKEAHEEHGTKTEHVVTENAAHEAVAEHKGGHHAEEVTVKEVVMFNAYNVFYFGFYIALAALFFLAGATLAWGGWQIQIQKIPLAIASNIGLFLILLFVMFAVFGHDIFEWMHEDLYNPASPAYDPILASKHDFLNPTSFWVFSIIIATSCVLMFMKWWKTLTGMDSNPSRKLFSSSRMIAAISIVIISFVINTFATWYWSMSIQPHWYSTMFTWNTMAGAAVTMFSIVILLMNFLKSKGYLPRVNANHEHDVAKLMFAISVFWTYTWFAQYMLIWYANIPEETIFFQIRRTTGTYGFIFHFMFLCNFVLPFFILMKRKAKRNPKVTNVVAFIIIFGQFTWFFLMNCPARIPIGGYGLISIGLLFMFGSIFIWVTLKALSRIKDLASTTHPFVEESYKLHI